MKKAFFIIPCILSILISCSTNSDQEILDIKNFILENDLNSEETKEGVFISVLDTGKVIQVLDNSKVEFSYKGYYLDKEVFDSTMTGNHAKLSLNATLKGLRYGLKHFGEGGKGTIIVPSSLGFGSNPPRGVRKNAVLVYEVEVFDFF